LDEKMGDMDGRRCDEDVEGGRRNERLGGVNMRDVGRGKRNEVYGKKE
jgi:hypothetical protein